MVFLDIETDGIEPTKIHFVTVKEKGEDPQLIDNPEGLKAFLESKKDHGVVIQNGLLYDKDVLSKLWGVEIPVSRIVDTLVVSKLMNYSRKGGHSLKVLTKDLAEPKGEYKGSWDVVTKEMIEYGLQDCPALESLYETQKEFIKDPKNSSALRLEHNCQYYLNSSYGFGFDKKKAEALLENIENELSAIDFSELDKRVLHFVELKAYKANGRASLRLINKVAEKYELVVDPKGTPYVDPDSGKNLMVKEVKEKFNPGSHTQRVDALWEAGWKPFEKTMGHIVALRRGTPVGEKIKKYGWKVNEANLETLPDSAPEAVKDLARWITLDSRRQSLQEYLDNCKEVPYGTSATEWIIKTKVQSLGAWTHRCSHSGPNLANVVSCWNPKKTAKSPVEQVKQAYDTHIRSLFTARKGYELLGVDAKGIQLRLLAHYMQDEEFTKELLDGDIHSKNQSILGSICKTRDDAKTFIYAWVLNAGIPKLAEILGCSISDAAKAKKNFEKAWSKGLRNVNLFIDKAVAKGGFEGLDGRWIKVPSRHKCLAGMLQSGEAIFMKRVFQGLMHFRQRRVAGFIHDEFQNNVGGNGDAIFLKEVYKKLFEKTNKALGLRCPQEPEFSPSTGTAKNWSETH